MTAKARTGGFTLIEVLVAFVILALALGGFLRVFSTGLEGTRTGEAYTVAGLIAESTLEAVGVEYPLEPGEREGELDDRFRWRLLISPYDVVALEEDERSPEDDEAVGPRLLEVSVSVQWDEGDDARAVRLTTLRLAPPQP